MINPKLLQLVINASNEGIVVAEQEGEDNILIYANPAFERLTGYSNEEILYQDCRFLQSGDRDQPAMELIREALRTRTEMRAVIYCATTVRTARISGTNCRFRPCSMKPTN